MKVNRRTLSSDDGTVDEITIEQGSINAVLYSHKGKVSATFYVNAWQDGYDAYLINLVRKQDALDISAVFKEASKYLND